MDKLEKQNGNGTPETLDWEPPSKSSFLKFKALYSIIIIVFVLSLFCRFVLYWQVPESQVEQAELSPIEVDFDSFNIALTEKLKLAENYVIPAAGPLNPEIKCNRPNTHCPDMRSLLKELSDDEKIDFMRGVALVNNPSTPKDDLEEALRIFEGLNSSKQDNLAVAFNLSYCLLLDESPADAVKVLDSILPDPKINPEPRLMPFFAAARFNQAVSYMLLRKYKDAAKQFRPVIRYFKLMANSNKFGPSRNKKYGYWVLSFGGITLKSFYPRLNLAQTNLKTNNIKKFKQDVKERKVTRAQKLFDLIYSEHQKNEYSSVFKLERVWAADNYRVIYAERRYRRDPIVTFNLGILAMKVESPTDAIWFFNKSRNVLENNTWRDLPRMLSGNLALMYLRNNQFEKANKILAELKESSRFATTKNTLTLSNVAGDLKQLRNMSDLSWEKVQNHFKSRLALDIKPEVKMFIEKMKLAMFKQGLSSLAARMNDLAKAGSLAELMKLVKHMTEQNLEEPIHNQVSAQAKDALDKLPIEIWLKKYFSNTTYQTIAMIALYANIFIALIYLLWFIRKHLRYRRILLDSEFISCCNNQNPPLDLSQLTLYARWVVRSEKT